MLDRPTEIFPTDPLVSGAWNIEETFHDRITGEILPQIDGCLVFRDVFDLSIRSLPNTIRFTDSNSFWVYT